MRERKKEYIARMEKDLKEWSADIDEFEARASRASTELEADYERNLRILKEKRDLLVSNVRKLGGSSTEAWKDLESSVEVAKHELKIAFDAARNTVRKAA